MKSRRPAIAVICFVAELNRSSAALPQSVLNIKGTVSEHAVTLLYNKGLKQAAAVGPHVAIYKQESRAIAKMTARCALCMWVP